MLKSAKKTQPKKAAKQTPQPNGEKPHVTAWWEYLEQNLTMSQLAFLLWLNDWHFHEAFKSAPPESIADKDGGRVNTALALVQRRIEKTAKPSGMLLATFQDAKGEMFTPAKMESFILEHHFEGWCINVTPEN